MNKTNKCTSEFKLQCVEAVIKGKRSASGKLYYWPSPKSPLFHKIKNYPPRISMAAKNINNPERLK